MGNLRNLRVADEKYKCLSIVHDMTQKERQLSKEKWGEGEKQGLGVGGLQVHRKGAAMGKKSGQSEKTCK